MGTSIESLVLKIAQNARSAALTLQNCEADAINRALAIMANLIKTKKEAIKRTNARDVRAAQKKGIGSAMMYFLTYDEIMDAAILTL